MKKKIIVCVGTRPNFIKIIRLKTLFTEAGYEYKLIHTGQHFDKNMSEIFFEQLKLGQPDFYLDIKGSDINETTANIIIKSSEVLKQEKPDLVIVVGDVNSTFACSFAAASLEIPIAHIESGLRSHRMSMPEERNRILTDSLSRLLFVTEELGVRNLEKENFESSKIKLVGNTMVDALIEMMPLIKKKNILNELNLERNKYALCTFHRPINVDNKENLYILLDIMSEISKEIKIVLPIHPRTKKNISKFSLSSIIKNSPNILLVDPLGYIEFINLIDNSLFILSDSGGIQTEASFLNKPCMTVRDETELISTIEHGTNVLVKLSKESIMQYYKEIINNRFKSKKEVQIWDGKASERIVYEVSNFLNS